MESKEKIIKDIEDFRKANSGPYSAYYIGITKHIEQRLVEANEVIQEHLRKGEYTEGNPTYSAECENRDTAVEIERLFQKKGMEKYNYRSVGVDDSKFIYCYKMTEQNKKAILNENETAKMKHLVSYNQHTKANEQL